ncbi:ECF subfamily RNA polymerase sigma-24 factor [mine drainage metagenome]|uniref:ECF subfamily RNA polymerase sigma-24 factor n=1 Tax=mine drainage metagenome TaxID=410659 RepID=T0XV11_9ZZZZ
MEETFPALGRSGTLATQYPLAMDDLVRRAGLGEVWAFERLYRTHHGHLYALCLRLTGNVQSAEECTQDTFIRAWQSLIRFQARSSFGTWLYRIGVNTVMERYRRELRQSLCLVPFETDEVEQVPSGDAPLGLSCDLDRAILQLPIGARVVFILHDIEGYGHPEIASWLHLAVGTSKAHLHRARRLLRARLGS